MNARPVWRWKSFWLGLCVLGVLSWAWARSMGRNEGVVILEPGAHRIVMRVCGAGFSVSRWPDLWNPDMDVVWFSRGYVAKEVDDPGWALLRDHAEYDVHWWVAFPMWMPFAGWLAVWGGWLGWRWRKEQRASLTESEIEAEVSR